MFFAFDHARAGDEKQIAGADPHSFDLKRD